jgi:hypothetical protein
VIGYKKQQFSCIIHYPLDPINRYKSLTSFMHPQKNATRFANPSICYTWHPDCDFLHIRASFSFFYHSWSWLQGQSCPPPLFSYTCLNRSSRITWRGDILVALPFLFVLVSALLTHPRRHTLLYSYYTWPESSYWIWVNPCLFFKKKSMSF